MGLNLNKSRGNLLKTSKNLQHFVGTNSYDAAKIGIEADICCGLGRKTLYFSKGSGTPTTFSKFPVTFNGTKYWSKIELAQGITEFFGVGYVAYIPTNGNVVVIGAQYKKQADGSLDLPDFIIIK